MHSQCEAPVQQMMISQHTIYTEIHRQQQPCLRYALETAVHAGTMNRLTDSERLSKLATGNEHTDAAYWLTLETLGQKSSAAW